MSGKDHEANLKRMLEHRMGWNVSEPACPFNQWCAYKVPATMEIVLLLTWRDKHATLVDDYAMYPSDELVTKIRMLTS